MKYNSVEQVHNFLTTKNKRLFSKYNDGKYIYTHKPHNYFTTLEEFNIDYVWFIMDECIQNGISRKTYFNTLYELPASFVKEGNRLNCFRRSQKCAGCGIIGNIFLLQNNNKPAFSTAVSLEFYNKSEAGLTHFTVDHIIPRVSGGDSSMENLNTMCYPCNQFKSKSENRPWTNNQR